MKDKILDEINSYYTQKISAFGSTPLGVDWNSKESQYLRFEKLCSIITPDGSFSLIDYGCGYGELINYLNQAFSKNYTYIGYDLSLTMLEQARILFGDLPFVKLYNQVPDVKSDYLIASGIFNVKPESVSNKLWMDYIFESISAFDQLTKKGFSVNLLTTYSDVEYLKKHLFYADPMLLFDFCKRNISKNVSLLHDYNLYEFTLIVRK